MQNTTTTTTTTSTLQTAFAKGVKTDQDGQRYVALSPTVRAYAQGGGFWAIAIGDERLPWLTANDVRTYASTL
jgi:hypothetical protein